MAGVVHSVLKLFRAFGPAHANKAQSAVERPRYIRILGGKKTDWEATTGDPKDLAGELFSKIEEPVSVFLVRSDEEELAAVAAHQAKRGSLQRDPVFVLRIDPSEVEAHKIRADETGGLTGVSQVDAAHRDFVARWDDYTALARTVMIAIRRGSDRIRRISRPILLHQLHALTMLPPEAFASGQQRKLLELVRTHQEHLPPPL